MSQYTIDVHVRKSGDFWEADSPQMPGMSKTSTSRSQLLGEVIRQIDSIYAGRMGEVIISVPLVGIGVVAEDEGGEPGFP